MTEEIRNLVNAFKQMYNPDARVLVKTQIANTIEDYEILGIKKDVYEEWENAQRSAGTAPDYEWWYFDTMLDDGSIFVIYFARSGYGKNEIFLACEIRDADGNIIDYQKAYQEDEYSTSKDMLEVLAGKHYIKGDLGKIHLHLDPSDYYDNIGVDLTITPEVPPNRIETSHWYAGDNYFAWFNPVPSGTVKGTVTINGKTKDVTGKGYHDHQWGNLPLQRMVKNWLWGRFNIEGYVVVLFQFNLLNQYGGFKLPLLYIANSKEGILYQSYGEASIELIEHEMKKHPVEDLYYGKQVLHGVSAKSKGDTVSGELTFSQGEVIRAMDFLDRLEIKIPKAAKKVIREEGIANVAYTRFKTKTSIKLVKDEKTILNKTGDGVLEFFDMMDV